MNEFNMAAAMGSSLSALNNAKDGWTKLLRVSLTGYFLAHFLALDVTTYINGAMGHVVSYGGASFLLGYFGSEIMERGIQLIRIYKGSRKWS